MEGGIILRYFNCFTKEEEKQLFYSPPDFFDNSTEQEILAHAIGAALYCPGTRATISDDIRSQKYEGLTSMVIDLEDAIGDHQIEAAEELLIHHISRLSLFLKLGTLNRNNLPLLFIRIRSAEQMKDLIGRLNEHVTLITGFVLPKFTVENGPLFFEVLSSYNKEKALTAPTLYGLPILETPSIIYKESRIEELLGIKKICDENKKYVLNVRIGATDFSSLFGLRRSPDRTIYDIAPIRDCIIGYYQHFWTNGFTLRNIRSSLGVFFY